MFSPRSAGGPATATRSRRRQRPHSSDADTLAQQQPKAKRQRLPVTDTTFAPQSTASQQQQIKDEPELLDAKNDTASRLDARPDGVENHDAPPSRRELVTRIKKPKHADRAASGDSSVILARNNAFIVSKLPAFPDRIRRSTRLDGEQRRSSISDVGAHHGEIDSSLGYGLSLSHTHAIIWPYDSASASPETFVFALPYPSKNTSTDPLPVGCLVLPSAASTEPGLVVVMPLTGKITYWESISAAATLDFMKQDRRGVESSVYGMFSGEKVTQVTNAESAGFVLSFSSGRMAYMSLRDGHGRPGITTQFLRMGAASPVGGLFGHLRYALGQSPANGDLAAVRAARSNRVGERDVVALTTKAKIHAWRLHRGGHHETLAEVDLRSDILAAMEQVSRDRHSYSDYSVEALDFAVVPRGLDAKYLDMTRLSDAIALDDDSITHLFVLVGLTRADQVRYAMVEVVMSKGAARTGLVHLISSYADPYNQAASAFRPRIYLPRPALVAFAVFERAVVVASVAAPPQSPHTQLLEDTRMLPRAYEDVIDFRQDDASLVIGAGFEEPPPHSAGDDVRNQQRHRTSKNPSVLLMVRGTGVLRVATTDVDKFADEEAPQVTCKSKLEQAIFFGAKSDNPLVFDRKQKITFADTEYESAAIEISQDLMASSSPLVAAIQWKSMEDNLATRSEALEKVMSYLNSLGVRLGRTARWELMFAAEKLAMARMLWRRHQGFIEERPSEDKTTVLGHVVEHITEAQKAIPNAARGEVDSVRHWFLHDVNNLSLLVAWCYEVIKHVGRDPRYDPARLTVLIQEAVQVTVCAVLGGHEFRKKNAAMFGLADEDMEYGILRSGHDGTPEPWTSAAILLLRLKRLLELCLKWLAQHPMAKSDSTRPDPRLLESIRQEVPLLTDLYLLSLCEASRWNAAVPDYALAQKLSQDYNKEYEAERYNKPLHVARLEMWAEATVIADKHRSWRSLSMILVDHIHALRRLAAEPTTSTSEADRLTAEAVAEERRVERMLDRHGQPFAFALYEILLDRDGVNGVLDFSGDRHGFKTKFLRTKPELAKISWIHDIDREKDIDHAAETLLQLGLGRETQVWNKKIELSLGKLALLAEKEKPASKTGMFNLEPAQKADKKAAQVDQIDRELGVIRIQNQLFSQVYLTVSDAIDEAAEVGLAMDVHGANLPKKHKILRDIFEDGITRLVKHEALEPMALIDLLTLISFKPEQVADMQDQFYLALQVAKHALRNTELDLATRLIWRRCFVRDDWARINDTSLKGDREVADRLSETALFSTCLACYEKEVAGEPFKFMTPSEALGAFTETLDRRFAESDKAVCDKMTAAMRAEDAALRKYVEKNRLEEWAQTTCNEARRFWTEYNDETTRNGVVGPASLSVGGGSTAAAAAGKYDGMETSSEDEDAVDMIKSNGLVTPPPGNDDVKARPRRV